MLSKCWTAVLWLRYKAKVTFPHHLLFVSDTNVLSSSSSSSPSLFVLLFNSFLLLLFGARVRLYLFAVWIFCFKCNMSVGILAENFRKAFLLNPLFLVPFKFKYEPMEIHLYTSKSTDVAATNGIQTQTSLISCNLSPFFVSSLWHFCRWSSYQFQNIKTALTINNRQCWRNRLKHMHLVQTIQRERERKRMNEFGVETENIFCFMCVSIYLHRTKTVPYRSRLRKQAMASSKPKGKLQTLRHACARLFNFITAKLQEKYKL